MSVSLPKQKTHTGQSNEGAVHCLNTPWGHMSLDVCCRCSYVNVHLLQAPSFLASDF